MTFTYRERRGIRIVCRTTERSNALMFLQSRLGESPELLAACRRVWARMMRWGRPFVWTGKASGGPARGVSAPAPARDPQGP